MRVYYDRDADVNLIKGKKVVIVGYGSQGRAHALNLKDSGAKNLAVALKAGSPTVKKAEADGFKSWLLSLSNRVAEAAKEGGFLGIGGTRVSEQEQSALKATAMALGISTKA